MRTVTNQNRAALYSYVRERMSEGRVVFTAAQAQEALGIGAVALIEAALRQQKRKRFISPRPGFYVIVPPRYQDRGAPPPD